MRLQDKVAIVTGGAAGIGRAICELFSEEGARVVIADIDSDGGNETAGLIADAGGDAVFVETDVSDEAQVANLVESAVGSYGGVNVLVNDAAAFVFGKVEDVTPAQWERVIGVNVLGPAYTVKHSLSHLRGCFQSLRLVLDLMYETQTIPQRPYRRTVGHSASLTPASQAWRTAAHGGYT